MQNVFALLFLYSAFHFFTADIDLHITEYDELGNAYQSPDGKHTAQVVYDYYGGAAGGVNLYVQLIDHKNDTKRYIYRADAKMQPNIQWQDDTTLIIKNYDQYADNSTILDIETEIYDETGRACNTYATKAYTCITDK